jgi:hypothetical protein
LPASVAPRAVSLARSPKASTEVTITAPDVEISNGGTTQPVKLADRSNSTVLKAQ